MSWAERAKTTSIEGHSSLSVRIIDMEDNYDYSTVLTRVLAGINLTHKLLTCASHTVSTVSLITGTSEGPRFVGTHSIVIARRLLHTFINI